MRKTLSRYAWWKEMGVGLFMLPLFAVAYTVYFVLWFPFKAVRRVGRSCLAQWGADEEARRWGQGDHCLPAPADFICVGCAQYVQKGHLSRQRGSKLYCAKCGPGEEDA